MTYNANVGEQLKKLVDKIEQVRTSVDHRANITTIDKVPVNAITAAKADTIPGSLTAVAHGIAVAPANSYGTAGSSAIITVTPILNKSIDVTIPQSANATHYDLFLSTTTTAPTWVGRVTEAQRATGGAITAVGTFIGGAETGDTANSIATKLRAVLLADSVISAKFDVSGENDKVILTAKVKAANDAALNIAVDNDTCVGIVTAASSENTTAGIAPVAQVETATVAGTIALGGNATIIFDSALLNPDAMTISVAGAIQLETLTVLGTITTAGDAEVIFTSAEIDSGTPVTLTVAVSEGDDAAAVAGKIKTAINNDVAIGALFLAAGTGAVINIGRLAAVANDSTLNLSVNNDTCVGLTPVLETTTVTEGVLVDTNDIVAEKIRVRLAEEVSTHYTVAGTGADVVITALVPAANDTALNLAINKGTVTGLTDAPASADTTAGVLGQNQVETATVAGTITTSGTAKVIVTSTNMTGSPKTLTSNVYQDVAAGVINIRVVGTGLASTNAIFAQNNAYTPDIVAAVESINCEDKSEAYVYVEMIVDDLRVAPSLRIIPFLKNTPESGAGVYYQDVARDIAIFTGTGETLRQVFVVDVDAADEMVLLVDSITGQGAKVSIRVELF